MCHIYGYGEAPNEGTVWKYSCKSVPEPNMAVQLKRVITQCSLHDKHTALKWLVGLEEWGKDTFCQQILRFIKVYNLLAIYKSVSFEEHSIRH